MGGQKRGYPWNIGLTLELELKVEPAELELDVARTELDFRTLLNLVLALVPLANSLLLELRNKKFIFGFRIVFKS